MDASSVNLFKETKEMGKLMELINTNTLACTTDKQRDEGKKVGLVD